MTNRTNNPSNQNSTQTFTTEDMHFAAFLLCQPNLTFKGVKNTEHDDTKCFAFQADPKRIDELLLTYYNRRGLIEPQAYDESQKKLRDLLKVERSRKRIISERRVCYGEDC
jgi:hypothetical protein